MKAPIQADELIVYDDRTWRVLNVGATGEDGRTYYHLADTKQLRGIHPAQIGAWLRPEDLRVVGFGSEVPPAGACLDG